jgi:hypothetical protein
MNVTQSHATPPPPTPGTAAATATVVQFMELRLELVAAVAEITQLAEAGFGKRPLLKKDYQTLLHLMQEAVASARYAVAFLKLIFKASPAMASSEMTAAALRRSFEGGSNANGEAVNPDAAAADPTAEEVDLLLSSLVHSKEDKLFESESCEVSPKNVLELASDRGFDEGQEEDYCRRSLGESAAATDLLLGEASILERSGSSDAHVSYRRRRNEKKERKGRSTVHFVIPFTGI